MSDFAQIPMKFVGPLKLSGPVIEVNTLTEERITAV